MSACEFRSVWNICRVPFPSGEPFVDAIESECEDPTYDRTEISEKCDEDHTRCDLVRPIPVAHVEKHARPETCFE